MTDPILRTIKISDLNSEKLFMKISRDLHDKELMSSIKKHGVLDPPLVVNNSGIPELLSGFNRVEAAIEAGFETIDVLEYYRFTSADFEKLVLLKIYRKEAGPVGRIKALSIMRNNFGKDRESLIKEGGVKWNIPDEFISDEKQGDKLLSMDRGLLCYIDAKDPGFKYIKMLMALPDDVSETIGKWAEGISMRVNVFKQIVEMIYETYTRHNSTGFFYNISPDLSADKKEVEEYLLDGFFRMRYPGLSSVLLKVSEISEKISSRGIDVDFPGRIERDYVEISFRLGRNSSPDSRIKALEESEKEIKELQRLL